MKLHQAIAIWKSRKASLYGEISDEHKKNQKSDLFNGLQRIFFPKDEQGEQLPPEKKKVQRSVAQAITDYRARARELCDVEAQIAWANCAARADVVVDGRVLMAEVPVEYLLFLEKTLTDTRTLIDALPVLDEGEDWSRDPNGLYRTENRRSSTTKKLQRPIVLYDAVVKDGQALPAQTQIITDDVIVGFWETQKLSGALPAPEKAALQERITKLLMAVKAARARANEADAPEKHVGAALFDYLFG